ncbi:DUF3793 family protein [Clostridium tunisiense]|uniref:DUF3793 family protein n=1 Tax=Clostridium tunisiense TaxID=219748 RepID=UPI0002D30D8A|nr:DUF3793 family protein [Clostridium tunisiense]
MRTILKAFRSALTTLSEKDYMKSVIAYNCAPTLKGLKAASTVTLCNYDRNTKKNWYIYKDEILKELSVKAFELREAKNYIAILFYDEKLLEKKLSNREVSEFLSQYGYNLEGSLNDYLITLKNRYDIMNCPHELGIFLDFPLEDVKTFITNPDKPFLLCGYWKVYHNKSSALESFKNFDRAKLDIIRNIFCDNLLFDEIVL